MIAKIIVKCIIYNRSLNRFLLIRRSGDDDIDAGTWENAGGCVEQGEVPEASAVREVREETGIVDIRIGRVAYVVLLDKERETPDLLIVYLCETDSQDVRLSSEHQDFIWADEKQCWALLPKPIISDFERNGVFEILRREGE